MASDQPPIAFEALPLDKSGPPGNAWGRFGGKDQLGTLNLLTKERVLEAAREIREGVRVSLDWRLDRPAHPFYGRQRFFHHVHHKAPRTVNDDVLMFNTQCGSQWDGFRHFGFQDAKKYYGGFSQEDIASSEALGINVWLDNGGIVGRGVLFDYAAWADRHGITYDPFTSHAIPAAHLRRLAEEDGIATRPGDVLFVRSGFTRAYEALGAEAAAALALRRHGGDAFVGVEPSVETLRWLWEAQFAAVAGDMPGFEVSPVWDGREVQLHQWLLAGWGTPIGEMFDLEALAGECRRLKRWTFFVTSMPLRVPGGVASPPNAVAIF